MKEVMLSESEVSSVHTIDINNLLRPLEEIINKYVNIPDGLVFIRGHRDPIYDNRMRAKILKSSAGTDRPTMPFISAYVVKECFELDLFNSYPRTNELKYNALTGKHTYIYSVNETATIGDVIVSKMCTDVNNEPVIHYDMSDMEEMIRLIKKCIDYISVNINIDYNSIYKIDISGNNFVFKKYISVRELRYQEAIDNLKEQEDV